MFKGILLLVVLLGVSCVKLDDTEGDVDEGRGKSREQKKDLGNSSGTESEPNPNPSPDPKPVSDPLIPHAWHLNNTGQKSFSSGSGTVGKDPKILSANKRGFSGSGIRIAVSDTGIETAHEDLSANMLTDEHRNYGLSSSPWLGDPVVSDGHGTSVAGLIGAVGGNGLGSRGVAYNAKIAGFRFLDLGVTLSKYIDQANGNFDIFNYSWGLPTCAYRSVKKSYIDQLKYGVSNLRGGKGAIYIKSGGNSWRDSLSLCDSSVKSDSVAKDDQFFGNATLYSSHNYPWQIVVGALNADGVKAVYSTPGSALWISAPGGRGGVVKPAMVTVDLSGCDNGYSNTKKGKNEFDRGGGANPDCNYTSIFNGTSSAAPVTSGVVALMLEANPNLTWRDVKYILAKTTNWPEPEIGNSAHPYADKELSNHVYLPGWVVNTAGFKFHNHYGFGGIDADAAVKMAAEKYVSPLGTFAESSWVASGDLSLAIPDKSATGTSHTLAVSSDMVVEGVQIELDVTHPRVSDLGVELTSPGGTVSVIIPVNSNIKVTNIDGWILSSNAFYMENSRGDWSIKLIDASLEDSAGNTAKGTLTGWKIKFFGYEQENKK